MSNKSAALFNLQETIRSLRVALQYLSRLDKHTRAGTQTSVDIQEIRRKLRQAQILAETLEIPDD